MIKISISYPPLESKNGAPLLSQNRQFQWFSNPTFIYPVILAQAATLLAQKEYEVFWDDAIAERLSYEKWKARIIREKPDLIVIETKTPVIKAHWEIIADLKKTGLKIENWKLKIILLGDHVTALPQESLKKSPVDYVIAGGDYDFALLNLANHLTKNEPLAGGVWQKNDKKEIFSSGPTSPLNHNLNTLPQIDRNLTRWKLYAFKNGNFKLTPGAYVMSGRDCWWGKCSFCSWTTLFPGESYRTVSAEKTLNEVGNLIELGAREVMDDAGTLPIGQWLQDFCNGMIARGYYKKITISCNMRLNAIKDQETWKLMKKAGFRMILFGLESANQKTLDQINKNLRIEEVEPALTQCVNAGLEPHLTVMIGYPWETKADAENSLNFVRRLFIAGLISSLQATMMIPYPGTPLFDYCQKNNLLLTTDYNRFDQREPVMKSAMSEAEIKKTIRRFYRSFLNPKFVFKKIISIRSLSDMRFALRAGGKVLGHLKDFAKR